MSWGFAVTLGDSTAQKAVEEIGRGLPVLLAWQHSAVHAYDQTITSTYTVRKVTER